MPRPLYSYYSMARGMGIDIGIGICIDIGIVIGIVLGFDVLRQGRAYLRDSRFKDLRHGVASAGIKYLVKRDNYLAGIYLLDIPYYFESLVISSYIYIIELFLLSILSNLRYLYLYAISPPVIYALIVLITLSFKRKDLELL